MISWLHSVKRPGRREIGKETIVDKVDGGLSETRTAEDLAEKGIL